MVLDIVRRLRDDIPMAVCCLDVEGAWAAQLRDEGVPVTSIGRRVGFHPTLGRAVAQVARRHGARVAHAHHYSPFVYAALARIWNPRLRVIYTEHGRLSDAPPSAKRKLANRLFSRAPHEVYTVSRDLKDHIVEEGFPPSSVSVIYNGIEVQPLARVEERARVRSALGIADETLVIGTIARLDPVKDLPTMIQAVGQLAHRTPVLLLVIGDGAERAALEQEAASCTPPGTVRFLGHRDDARSWLAGCDVYANSSIHEGVSLTILEAMSAALPIVATRVGGTPEIVDAHSGLLVNARDPQAMATALQAIAADPARRLALGRSARRRVEERFTIERMVNEYRDAYLRVAR